MNSKIGRVWIPLKYTAWWFENKQSNGRIGRNILMSKHIIGGILITQL